ncbi:MAG: molybdopterin-guanine dinucleotide biosynthesis protein B [Deltaproteobacteria bacterium]|jgi:molybdopterin-guanine dinucleotide biosynthesis protein B
MLPPVISLVGRPDCGKTTLLEKLIPELNRRGYRVGTIKHHVHRFDMDRPGKDTWRHKRAGAKVVALSSPTGLGIIRDVEEDTPIEELVARYFDDVDLVITEGYKRAAMPKIEVYRRAAHSEPLPADHTWVAIVSDVPIAGDLPHFRPEDASGLADFLVERFLSLAPCAAITLLVDGKAVPLNQFAGTFLRQAVAAMVGSLKGCDGAREINLRIHNDE